MRALVAATLFVATASLSATAQAPAQSGAPDVSNVQAAARAAAPKAPMDHVMIVPKSEIDNILNPAPGTHPFPRLFDGGSFSVNVIHRKPGDTEGALMHKYTSEVYVVQSGGGTLVTGGHLAEPVNAKDPDMQGSKSIEGGTPQEVHAGDVVFVPAGVPHYFTSYAPDVVYLNVRFQDPKYVAN
jgi:mannose-6-phosphate isomerase-like protein (cupin superfamily)